MEFSMSHTRNITAAISMILLAALTGCNSKQEKAAQTPEIKPGQTQSQITSNRMSAKLPAAAVAASPQDETDAATVKARVLSQVKNREFTAIYKEASEGFKKVGPGEQFVAFWDKQLEETGAFKEAKETGHTVRPTDKFIVFTFVIQYEKKKKELRLTFGRSKKGVMELTGINQREVK
jgi:hypothetical protein